MAWCFIGGYCGPAIFCELSVNRVSFVCARVCVYVYLAKNSPCAAYGVRPGHLVVVNASLAN